MYILYVCIGIQLPYPTATKLHAITQLAQKRRVSIFNIHIRLFPHEYGLRWAGTTLIKLYIWFHTECTFTMDVLSGCNCLALSNKTPYPGLSQPEDLGCDTIKLELQLEVSGTPLGHWSFAQPDWDHHENIFGMWTNRKSYTYIEEEEEDRR